MKKQSLIFAVAIIAVANTFALAHAWLNRTGQPDAAITLTQADLDSWHWREADSGLDMHFLWRERDGDVAAPWESRHSLEALGFHCSPDEDCSKQPARRGFAALQMTRTHSSSFLVVDVALSAEGLRARYPDTASVIVVPAAIAIRSSGAYITELPSHIHIPKPYSAELRRRRQANEKTPFRLHVNYGTLHEPWVTSVDFPSRLSQ